MTDIFAVLLYFFSFYFQRYHRNRQTNLVPTYRMMTALQHFPLKAIQQVKWTSYRTYSWHGHTLDMVGCNYCTAAWAPVVPALLNRPTIKLQKTVIHRKSKNKSGLGFCFGCFFLCSKYCQFIYMNNEYLLVDSNLCETTQNEVIHHSIS